MKKVSSFLVCFLLTGCFPTQRDMLREWVYGPPAPKEIPNPECNFVEDGVKVFQVIDSGILVKFIYSDWRDGSTIEYTGDDNMFYIPLSNQRLKTVYDGEVVRDSSICFKLDGTYSYTTAMGSKNTIRKLKLIEPKYIPNPEYKENDS